MWPFKKHKPEVRFEIADTYMLGGFKLKIMVDGEEQLNEYVSLLSIDAHNRRIDSIQADHYKRLKSIEGLIKAQGAKTQSSIWHVLGCMPTTDRTMVEKAFRRMAMVYHPDHGGTSGAFQTLTQAKEKALAKCK